MSLFLDFDGTITVQDTVGELANFALRHQAGKGHDLKDDWDVVVKAYIDDYKACVNGYHIKEDDRCDESQEIRFLRDMKDIETQSLGRIKTCRVFHGISPEAFREGGQELVRKGIVKLRPGFKKFLDEKIAAGWKVCVISVNWSSAFIEGAVGNDKVTVIANNVLADGSVTGPDLLTRSRSDSTELTNSCDKLQIMKALADEHGNLTGPSVYFGDSITDLECLLAAKQGVVISDKEDSKLLETLRRIGKDVRHVREPHQPGSLVWASNYDEVMELEILNSSPVDI